MFWIVSFLLCWFFLAKVMILLLICRYISASLGIIGQQSEMFLHGGLVISHRRARLSRQRGHHCLFYPLFPVSVVSAGQTECLHVKAGSRPAHTCDWRNWMRTPQQDGSIFRFSECYGPYFSGKPACQVKKLFSISLRIGFNQQRC